MGIPDSASTGEADEDFEPISDDDTVYASIRAAINAKESLAFLLAGLQEPARHDTRVT